MDANKSKNNDKAKKIKQSYEIDIKSLENAAAESVILTPKEQASADSDIEIIKYPVIKRMLKTLDRFLTKKFGLIFVCCACAITACSVGLFINNATTSNAGTDGSNPGNGAGNIDLNTWLWAGIALFAFVAILSLTFFIARRRSKKTS